MKDILVVLTKAEWCGHCKVFAPIFKISEEKVNENDYLKDKKITFESYDMEKEKEVKEFKNKYGEENANKIDGYPTAFIVILDNNKIKNFEEVKTTRTKDNGMENEAAKDFLSNIEVKLKTLLSENKDKYVNTDKVNGQTGGSNYKHKYLKYKNKYLELKKNF